MKRITINNIPEQSYSTKESLRAVRTNIFLNIFYPRISFEISLMVSL